MIRIRGFARKTGRLTKGGSLPASAREFSSRAADSEQPSERQQTMGNNGHNGNGADATHLARGANATRVTSTNGAHSSHPRYNGDDAITRFLHRAVENLVHRPARVNGTPAIERNGHDVQRNGSGVERNGSGVERNGHAVTIDGESVPNAEAVFAHTRILSDSFKPIPQWKRVFDVTCIVLALPLWLPLLLIVIGWIKLVSPGPIFYRQERIGYRGRRFMLFKFRTMHVNAETRSHEEYFAHLMRSDCPMTKLDSLADSRLIRCGRLLRASGLDELPQLFNMLRGEMSLVGPRPCLPTEFERYTPAQQRRVNALPGLTGYWQVNGKNQTTFSEMIAMDIRYAEQMSVWLDVKIILKTVPVLVVEVLGWRRARKNDFVAPTQIIASAQKS